MKNKKRIILPTILSIISVVIIKSNVFIVRESYTGLPLKMDTTFQFITFYIVFFVIFYNLCNLSSKIKSKDLNKIMHKPETEKENTYNVKKKKIVIIPAILSIFFTTCANLGILTPKDSLTDKSFRIENPQDLILFFIIIFILSYLIFNLNSVLNIINKKK